MLSICVEYLCLSGRLQFFGIFWIRKATTMSECHRFFSFFGFFFVLESSSISLSCCV